MKIEIKPDWSKAPTWANYWAVDINGSAFWYAKKPESDWDDEGNEYGVWVGDKNPVDDEEWVKNWKETLCKRPEPEQEETAQTDLELLLNEFREFKRLLSSELEMYNKRLNKLEHRDNQGNTEPDELAKSLMKGFLRKRL